ncbi:MAG: hypothetical protein K0R82_1498 [Flavipsychrobacter sp.]|jgi:hypothetical protein|nr:hypothetical protein [Flavipsychrobacter sp.]
MRLPLLFLTLATLSFSALAQQPYKFTAPGRHFSPNVRQALAKQRPATAQKTTAAHERVSGFSVYVFNGSGMDVQDSSNYFYSNARGSVFNANELFINEDNILLDSATYFVDNGSGIEFDRAQKGFYDNANRRTSLIELRQGATSTPENFRDRRAVYNSNGDLAIEYVLGWNSGTNAWDSLSRKHFAYDTQNQLIADSIYVYSSAQFMGKSEYTLDANGNQLQWNFYQWQSGNWVPTVREIHTYDALSNLRTNTSQRYNTTTTAWVNSSFDTFAYNNSHVYHFTESQVWDTVAAVWVNSSQEFRTLNASADRVLTQDMKQWDESTTSWQDASVIDWTYNAMGNPTQGIITVDFGGSPMEVANINLFYEVYDDLNVAGIQHKQNSLTVYPNPAMNTINLKWAKAVSNAGISLTNMAGQQVYRTSQPLNGTSASLHVDHLPAGTYLLNITNDSGVVTDTKTVVKH